MEALQWLDDFPNLYLGITPVVTYSTARGVHETVRFMPINRLLFETDAPYFVPAMVSKFSSVLVSS